MNIKFTREKFMEEFGPDSIEKLFPLKKIFDLTTVKLDLMANPTIAIIKHEYFSAVQDTETLHWQLEVQYWLEDGRLRGKICAMILFESLRALEYQMAISKKGRLELNQN